MFESRFIHTIRRSGWGLEASRGTYVLSMSNDAGDSLGAIDIEVQIPPKALVVQCVLQCAAVCCCVLLCAALCCSVIQWFATMREIV